MTPWLRFTAILLVSLAALALLGIVGAGAAIGGQYADDVQGAAHGRPRETFWLMLFAVVMATSLLAAARRAAGHLSQAVGVASRRR